MDRDQQWVGKYRKPATGGGKPGNGGRKAKKPRDYLDNVGDQAFNKS